MASWKAAEELARSEQRRKTDLSAKGEESNTEAQREAIASWNKVYELIKRELSSRDSSARAPSSDGSTRRPSPEGRPATVLSPKIEKAVKTKERKSHREHEDKPQDKSCHERHKAKGLCFVCHKSGHFSRDCPERKKVPSTLDKPPDIENFGIDTDFGDVENQRQLSTCSQDSELTVNNIHIIGDNDESDDDVELDDLPEIVSNDLETEVMILSELDNNTSMKQDTREYNPWIGDPLGLRAEEQLIGICYPGDDHLSLGVFDSARFCIYQVEGDRHIVIESERDELRDGDSIYVPDELLRDPHFDIVQ